jgi:hypothetical protein
VVLLARAVAGAIGALAIASLGASGCHVSRPLTGAGGRSGEAGAGAGGAVAGAAGADTDAAGGTRGGQAGTSGWPATLTLVNAGTADIALPEEMFSTCGFSILVGAVDGGAARVTSAIPPDSWCDCDRCASTGRRLCDTVDPICDGPPAKLAPGGHLDIAWDGRVAVTASPPPPGSTCPFVCDHWEDVAPGIYTFAVETLSGEFTAQATLPPTSASIILPINGGH